MTERSVISSTQDNWMRCRKGLQRDKRKLFGVMEIIILIMGMVSWIHIYVKTCHRIHLNTVYGSTILP